VFSNVVDGVIIVLKQDVTSDKAGLLAIQLPLQGNARIIGDVLNMSKSDRLGRYYYNYGKQSKYLSYYYSIDNIGNGLFNIKVFIIFTTSC
jgi:Mrp family chromosome partitioning ATPase